MKNQNKDKSRQQTIDAIAEQWVNLIFEHVKAKRSLKKRLIKISNNHEYAQ